jgi:hypothetical protein
VGLRKADSAKPAHWIVERIHPFAQDVGSVVPEGFDAYVRVFHPAWKGGPEGHPVTWAEIAASTNRLMHPGAQWPHIAFTREVHDINDLQDPPPGAPWDAAPEEGSLDLDVAQKLVEILAPQTSTPERCWFAFWDGWGIPTRLYPFGSPPQNEQRKEEEEKEKLKRRWDAPSFELPHRRYLLFHGPIEGALESFYGDDSPGFQSASLWWPEDRTWCVATEVDFENTYAGGSRGCMDALLADEGLESLEVEPSQGITWDSDTVNPDALRF